MSWWRISTQRNYACIQVHLTRWKYFFLHIYAHNLPSGFKVFLCYFNCCLFPRSFNGSCYFPPCFFFLFLSIRFCYPLQFCHRLSSWILLWSPLDLEEMFSEASWGFFPTTPFTFILYDTRRLLIPCFCFYHIFITRDFLCHTVETVFFLFGLVVELIYTHNTKLF